MPPSEPGTLRRRRPIICLVTDRRRLATGADLDTQLDALIAQAKEASRSGIDVIHVREADLEGAALVDLTRRIVGAVHQSPTRILVNDRADVAIAAGAHGVHLRGDSYAASRCRVLGPSGWTIGRSVHERSETAAVSAGADYVAFGTVFQSASKTAGHPVRGPEALREAVGAAACPLLAIGGISLSNLDEVAGAGAAGVAAIELFLPPSEAAPGRPGIAVAVAAIRSAFGGV
jgi:thiamine-phosphate diphosphorylase